MEIDRYRARRRVAEIIETDWCHSQGAEDPRDLGKLARTADPDGTVPLSGDALKCPKPLGGLPVLGHEPAVHFLADLDQRPVGGDLAGVEGGQRDGEAQAQLRGTDMTHVLPPEAWESPGVRARQNLPPHPGWSWQRVPACAVTRLRTSEGLRRHPASIAPPPRDHLPPAEAIQDRRAPRPGAHRKDEPRRPALLAATQRRNPPRGRGQRRTRPLLGVCALAARSPCRGPRSRRGRPTALGSRPVPSMRRSASGRAPRTAASCSSKSGTRKARWCMPSPWLSRNSACGDRSSSGSSS